MTLSTRRRADVDPKQLQSLQDRLPQLWTLITSSTPWEHTSVVVPSLSFDSGELAKIDGVSFYEERLLFTLMRLRHPGARVVYVTSQPIHREIIEYYLQLLVGVTAGHASRRLMLLNLFDASPKPLTLKILERPRLIQRIQALVGNPARAYLTCFNATALEEELAVRLDIPLNAVSSRLLPLGSKSGARQVFRDAGVACPEGRENLRSESEMIGALWELKERRPAMKKAVVKLNESFAGQGNAIFRYPPDVRSAAGIEAELRGNGRGGLELSADETTYADYIAKFSQMGGVVEEFVEAEESHSPSVQMRINPLGQPEMISTHDQVLGGPVGQEYLGCRFPASPEYREIIQSEAIRVAQVLGEQGVVSRFAVDFVVLRNPGEEWKAYAIEINLRMGGTTHPFQALEFLTGGRLEGPTGVFRSVRGTPKYYFSTDNLMSPAYAGLLPEDLFEILAQHGIGFHPATERGVLFHMIGALSQFGKIGVTCIADSPNEADELYDWTRQVLDRETGASSEGKGQLVPMFDHRLPSME